MDFSLDDQQGVHSYEGYGLLDFLGDLGGIAEIFLFFSGLIVASIANHNFFVKAL